MKPAELYDLLEHAAKNTPSMGTVFNVESYPALIETKWKSRCHECGAETVEWETKVVEITPRDILDFLHSIT